MATAIFTKNIPTTNTKPARIKAWFAADPKTKVILSREKLENLLGTTRYDECHKGAAKYLCQMTGKKTNLAAGESKNGFVFVFID